MVRTISNLHSHLFLGGYGVAEEKGEMIMEEIYWITRLDGIHSALVVFLCISGIITVVSIIGYIIEKCSDEDEGFDKILKYAAPSSLILTLLLIFIPTTKEILMIYGVGGTLDYVQSNEKIQQLPDKVVDAIDLFIEDYLPNDTIK